MTESKLGETLEMFACEKYATRKRSSNNQHDLINTRNVITIMGFPVLLHIRGIDSCNIDIIWIKD